MRVQHIFQNGSLHLRTSGSSISVRMDLLEARYLEFCTKEGVKPKPIEEETQVMKDFNLSLEWKIDTSNRCLHSH